MSRTCRTSSIQREVIHAHGHSGSNQKSTRAGLSVPVTSSPIVGCGPSQRSTTGFNQLAVGRMFRNPRHPSGTHVVGSA